MLTNNDIAAIQRVPTIFLRKVLGINTIEDYQEMICQKVAVHSRIAIAACHALGKTWLMARIAMWFLYSYKGAKVITTAPTARQVEMLLWGEIGVAFRNSKMQLGGDLTGMKLKLAPDWYALGFSPKKEAGGDSGDDGQKGSTFQGWHGDYILIIFDEAVGVPADIWTQVEGLLTSGKVVKFIGIANPTTKNCNFYDCFKSESWLKIYLSCFDSPNLAANGIRDINDMIRERDILKEMDEESRLKRIAGYKKPVTHLLSCQWVFEKLLEWGIDHPLFQSKVLGKFPDTDDSVMIQLGDVTAAQDRDTDYKEKDRRYVGVDVARFGEDLSVFTELFGTVHTRTKALAKRDTTEVSGNLIRFLLEEDNGQETFVLIDGTGIGSGVIDQMKEAQRNKVIPRHFKIIEIHFGASVKQMQHNDKPTEKELQDQATYANLKSYMFDKLAVDLKSVLRLRKDSIYTEELPTIKYKFNGQGKMIVESKDEYKKRTGKKSPDYSDSLALANLGRYMKPSIDYLRQLTKGK